MTSMPERREARVKAKERPPFERIALLLQGGGALGAYQAGVYEALVEAHVEHDPTFDRPNACTRIRKAPWHS